MRRLAPITVAAFAAAVAGCGLTQSGTGPAEDVPLPDLKAVSSTALGGHGQAVGSAAFSRDGRLVATGCHDRKVRVFDAAAGTELHVFEFGDDVADDPGAGGVRTRGLPEGVAFDSGGTRLAAVGGNWLNPPASLASVFDLTAKSKLFTSRAHQKGVVHGAVFAGDGKFLVTAGHDSTVRVLDAVTGKEQGTFKGHDWVVTAVAVSPDGRSVASVCCNSPARSVRLWDPATLRESRNIPLPDRVFALHDLAFSPDGKHVAGVSNWTVHVWDAATGLPVANAGLDGGLFKRLAYSPDGQRIAVAGGQGGFGKGIVRVFDVAAGRVHSALADAAAG